MSYDLYFWKWRPGPHVSKGICYLLMVEGLECKDAARLNGGRLKAELLRSISRMGGSADCEVSSRGLILETHGMETDALLDSVAPVVRSRGLVLFDPQSASISGRDRSEAEAIVQRLKSEDEQVRLQAELPELRARVEAGDTHALVELGNRYFFGDAVDRDIAQAFRLYLRAAEAGNDAGMVNVASCYRRGEGVAKNPDEAVKWYERATQTDHTFAPYELGEMYERGEGVASDPQRAIQLFFLALEGDHPDARKALRRLGALPPVPHAFVRP